VIEAVTDSETEVENDYLLEILIADLTVVLTLVTDHHREILAGLILAMFVILVDSILVISGVRLQDMIWTLEVLRHHFISWTFVALLLVMMCILVLALLLLAIEDAVHLIIDQMKEVLLKGMKVVELHL
jgi:mannose/fructose/N-acetylgalactosamine-specific phosphotransferase system component IIC